MTPTLDEGKSTQSPLFFPAKNPNEPITCEPPPQQPMTFESVHISITPHPSSGVPSETIVSPRSSPAGKIAGRIQASNVSDVGAKTEGSSAFAVNDEAPSKVSDLGADGKDSASSSRFSTADHSAAYAGETCASPGLTPSPRISPPYMFVDASMAVSP